jgi:hypothetical protein
MLDYEIFKAVVEQNFLRYLPEEYRDAEIKVYPVKKVNRTLDGLAVLPADGSRIFPTIYVNDMYEHYQACDNLETVLRDAAGSYAKVQDNVKGFVPDMDIGHVRDHIIMCLINTEQNREMLSGMPNRQFHDLSVIYRWVVERTPDAVGSVIVSDKIAEEIGMTEEELFQCAVENTRRMNPVSITCMGSMFGGIPEGITLPQEVREEMERAKRTADNMWIISNKSGINGAASMLYEENLHQLAEKLGENLFILPSSIHEVIAMPAEMAGKNLTNLIEMVQEVNMGSVELGERLSNSVYHYDRNARKVTLAAESPEKRLDGKQAEMPLIQEEKKTR